MLPALGADKIQTAGVRRKDDNLKTAKMALKEAELSGISGQKLKNK